MVTITAVELQREFGRFRDLAMKEPVSITHHGRETLVLVSVDEFKRLKSMEDELNRETEQVMDERVAVHLDTLKKLALR